MRPDKDESEVPRENSFGRATGGGGGGGGEVCSKRPVKTRGSMGETEDPGGVRHITGRKILSFDGVFVFVLPVLFVAFGEGSPVIFSGAALRFGGKGKYWKKVENWLFAGNCCCPKADHDCCGGRCACCCCNWAWLAAMALSSRAFKRSRHASLVSSSHWCSTDRPGKSAPGAGPGGCGTGPCHCAGCWRP